MLNSDLATELGLDLADMTEITVYGIGIRTQHQSPRGVKVRSSRRSWSLHASTP
jgi:hypothetical protein